MATLRLSFGTSSRESWPWSAFQRTSKPSLPPETKSAYTKYTKRVKL